MDRNKPMPRSGPWGRRKPLDPGEPPARTAPMPSRRRQAKPGRSRGFRAAETGPQDPTAPLRFTENECRITVYNRAVPEGETEARCEWCGRRLRFADFVSWHHRLPGQMGGDQRSYWNPARLMLLCGSGTTGCHGLVEGNRRAAYALGLLVRRGPLAEDPAETCARTLVLVRGGWGPVSLLHKGSDPVDVVTASLHTMQGFPARLTVAGGYDLAAA